MTGAGSLPSACYATLVQCLQSLSEGCPDNESTNLALHRLRNLILVLQSQNPTPVPPSANQLPLTDALTLTGTSQGLLATLRGPGARGAVNAEMDQALSETLATLSQKIGATLRAQQADRIRGLYVIVDPQVTGGRDPMEIARAAVRGGARMLQLRDKLRDKGEILKLAEPLQQLCQDNDVMLIVNDHVDLAAAIGSAGVHVGQTDLPVEQARQVLGPAQVLGRSNREIQQLIESQEMGADHVAFGAIYQTTTKSGTRAPQGVEPLRRAREVTKVPLVAIGGINAENVAPVVEAGADAICVTAAVASAPEPEAAAIQLVEAIRSAGGKV
ncbi:MAG: thiamine phosphate synthase [Chloroflexi bacterium]|nr:thiamine phosphate synthase [Chloroflexota bacterium]MCI0864959.1 thiamine phosphate synthase [Chloroflexota bacterium]